VKFVQRDDGREAVADDMPPVVRVVALLLEHANARRAAALALPCPSAECHRHRGAVRCRASADGHTLIVEAV
jgi:hypothetical protein